MATEDIPTRLAQLKPKLEQEYPISELGIFGTECIYRIRQKSDI
ncbi:hypothetical protein [Halorubrum ezzemoulense]|nr:hypothetical protein [Halorubrum ezzemoulense]MDB9235850.1 hypothetical protein [Halorubrum ezzemoulense]